MRIIGRDNEIQELERYATSPHAEFVAISGRKGLGKTFLVRAYFSGTFAFSVTGVMAGSMADELAAFNAQLAYYGGAQRAESWASAFECLRKLLEGERARRDPATGKLVVLIDEPSWFDTPGSRFLPALVSFWRGWASLRDDVLLVACASSTPWVARHLLHGQGAHPARVTGYIELGPLTLRSCEELLVNNGVALSRGDVLRAYMVFGGIPAYLVRLDRRLSLEHNVDWLCFCDNGPLRREFRELYQAQFTHPERHLRVVRALSATSLGLSKAQLLEATGYTDDEVLTRTLDELQQCGFVRVVKDVTKRPGTIVYQLADLFSLFWLRFVEGSCDEHGWSSVLTRPAVRLWANRAFRLVCRQHVHQILYALGIWGVAVVTYAWHSTDKGQKARFDLVLDRADAILNLVEARWTPHGTPYTITRMQARALLRREERFIDETRTVRPVHLTLVTPGGVRHNAYAATVQSLVRERDLFAV